MSPTWYDVLGVEQGASTEEVRAAWKAGIADLDPTDRRFRSRNEAAEVLLDPQRRASYDASLEEPSATPAAAGSAAPTRDDAPTAARAGLAARLPRRRPPRNGETAEKPARTRTRPARTRPDRPARTTSVHVPTWLVIVVAAVVAALVAVTALVWLRPHVDPDDVADAQTAAEQAIVPVLSYDYRHLDEDADTARGYLTSSYAEDYDQLFAVIEQNAARVQPVVTAEVIASSVVRTGTDQVDVLLFVNRPTTNASTQAPVVSRDQVTVSMVEQDGEWLVNQLLTTPPPA